jgi:hypothetical protein
MKDHNLTVLRQIQWMMNANRTICETRDDMLRRQGARELRFCTFPGKGELPEPVVDIRDAQKMVQELDLVDPERRSLFMQILVGGMSQHGEV